MSEPDTMSGGRASHAADGERAAVTGEPSERWMRMLGGSKRWWLPYTVIAVLAALALVAMIWQLMARGPVIATDWPIHEFFFDRQADGAARFALDTLSRPGQRWFTLPVIMAVGAYVSWRQQRLRPLVAVVTGLGTAYVLGTWIKEGLSRTPPFRDVDILHGVGEAFPSGHAANATFTWALITILFFGRRGLWPNRRRVTLGFGVTAALVALVGAIMVVNDYHWLSDIPGGIAVGLLALMASLLVLGPRQGPPPSPQGP